MEGRLNQEAAACLDDIQHTGRYTATFFESQGLTFS